MSKIKIKFQQLLEPNKPGLNKELNKFIQFPAKHANLKYDLNLKLSKAIVLAFEDYETLRQKLCEENSKERTVVFQNGKEIKTRMIISDAPADTDKDLLIATVDGDEVKGKIIGDRYDIIDQDNFDKLFGELLLTDIELNAYPIKLSRLEAEDDCSSINFAALEPFIFDDRENANGK